MAQVQGDAPEPVAHPARSSAATRQSAGTGVAPVQLFERRASRERIGETEPSRPFLIPNRPSPQPDPVASTSQRPAVPLDSFSNIGASLYAAADSAADVPYPHTVEPSASTAQKVEVQQRLDALHRRMDRDLTGGNPSDYSGGYSSGASRLPELEPTQVIRPVTPQRLAAMEQVRLQAVDPPRLEQRHAVQVGITNTNITEQDTQSASAPGRHGLRDVVSTSVDEDELTDDGPPCVIDCGAPPPEVPQEVVQDVFPQPHVAEPLRVRHVSATAEAPQVVQGVAADGWSSLGPSQGGKPFLLPFSLTSSEAQGQRAAAFPPQVVGAAQLNGAAAVSAGGAASCSSTRIPGTSKDDAEREALLQQLQDEMGFSRYQVTEAFKRCSTAEAAIDWILSPEREWDENWR